MSGWYSNTTISSEPNFLNKQQKWSGKISAYCYYSLAPIHHHMIQYLLNLWPRGKNSSADSLSLILMDRIEGADYQKGLAEAAGGGTYWVETLTPSLPPDTWTTKGNS